MTQLALRLVADEPEPQTFDDPPSEAEQYRLVARQHREQTRTWNRTAYEVEQSSR